MPVFGRGKQKGLQVGPIYYDELPKTLLMTRRRGRAGRARVIEVIEDKARTGFIGDGKIFVSPVEDGLHHPYRRRFSRELDEGDHPRSSAETSSHETKEALAEIGLPVALDPDRSRAEASSAATSPARCSDMDQDGTHLQLDARASSSPRPRSTRSSTTLPKVALFVPKRMLTMIVRTTAVDDGRRCDPVGQPTGPARRRQDLRLPDRGCRHASAPARSTSRRWRRRCRPTLPTRDGREWAPAYLESDRLRRRASAADAATRCAASPSCRPSRSRVDDDDEDDEEMRRRPS